MSRYEIYDKIGAGGAATVHMARLVGAGSFERVVAIKRLLPHIARDEGARAELVTEARLAARVSHPNVVQLFDVLVEHDDLFLVMEYVHGESLGRLLGASRREGGPPPPAIGVAIVASVLRGLHAAHEAVAPGGERLDLVHRDVSPQNVVVGADGVARLVDFGIAKATGRAHRTRTGEVKGKLGYMPPEQLCGEPLDRRADIFAAGVVLWEALVGRRLFRGASDEESISLALAARVDPPSAHVVGVPEGLDAIVLKALAVDPRERYATALEMAVALERHPSAAVGEISEWVERLGSDALAERTRSLAKIGQEPPELVVSSEGSALTAAKPEAVAAALTAEPSGDRAGVVASSRARVVVTALAVLVAVGVAVGAAVGAFHFHRAQRSSRPSAGDAPTTRSVEASSTAAADVSETSPEVAASSSAASGAAATPQRGPRRRPSTPGGPCSPPFTVDGSGRKHFKPECF